MTDNDAKMLILNELASKPIRWFINRPEKVQRLVDGQFDLPKNQWPAELVLKYIDVLHAAGFDYCDYCGCWVEASTIVRISTETWYPSSGTWRCCEGSCEISLLRSR